MAGLLINVQLEILVQVKETSPCLIDQKVISVLLRNEIGIVSVTQGRLDFDNLSRNLLPDGMSVSPFSLAASFPQATLHHAR